MTTTVIGNIPGLRWYQHEAVEAMLNAEGNRVVVAPTGSGKTRIITAFLQHYEGNVVLLSHVKEILEQNFSDLLGAGLREVGIWSAGLGIKTRQRITVAGIQSVYKEIELFKDTDLVIIDECHLVNHENEGMYRQFVGSLGTQVLGLTATPFRMKHGYIWNDGGLFDGPCYDLTDQIPRLIEEGYLSPLVTHKPMVVLETDDIRLTGGEFSQKDMDEKLVLEEATELIVQSFFPTLLSRRSTVIFAINIKHAMQIQQCLIDLGIPPDIVHSKMPDDVRDQNIRDFKEKKSSVIINVGILTIGFDAPHIDLIILMRPTQSASLYAQMVGRGLRVCEGKEDCMVLDHGGNIERHGFIDKLNIDIHGKKKKGKGKAPVKPCVCGLYLHLKVKECPECGHKFVEKNKLTLTAFNADVYRKKVNWHKVSDVRLTVHNKKGAPPSVKVTYVCGLRHFNEWLCINHPGGIGLSGRRKLKNRWIGDPPDTPMEVCRDTQNFKRPVRIEVTEVSKYPEILSFDYG